MVLNTDTDVRVGLFELFQHGQEKKVQGGLAGADADHAFMQSGEHFQFFFCGL